jgi:hypothetical protein
MAGMHVHLGQGSRLLLSHGRWVRMLPIIVVAGAVVLGIPPAARADDRETATAVITAQLLFLKQQTALNKCLAASPHKNTPCTTRNSLKLAKLADQQIKLINAAMDGGEIACVRTVAQQEITILRLWRNGALALYRNERKKAKRLFVQSGKIIVAQGRLQPSCFAEVLVGDGP